MKPLVLIACMITGLAANAATGVQTVSIERSHAVVLLKVDLNATLRRLATYTTLAP